MAIPDTIQTLSAAFVFGILVQAATSAFLIYFKGHGGTILQDHRRLVLVLFIIAAALWAQLDFLNFVVPTTSPNACQGTIVVSTIFDQAARVLIGGYLLWAVGHTVKSPIEKYGIGGLMGTRVVAGAVFVGFTRPQFAPLCVARSDSIPVTALILALDGIIISMIAIRIVMLGLLNDFRAGAPKTKQEQSKALVYCAAGFTFWTGTSVTMILGLEDVILFLRTAIPANGLLVLITILIIYPGALLEPREDITTPEAQSPFVAPRALTAFDQGNGSPMPVRGYSTGGHLFVVNPSTTPHASPTVIDLDNDDDLEKEYVKVKNAIITSRAVEKETTPREQKRSSSGIFGTVLVAPHTAPFVTVIPPPPAMSVTQGSEQSAFEEEVPPPTAKRFLFGLGRSKSAAQAEPKRFVISKPVMNNDGQEGQNPFARMQTVDLATAAANERQRREGAEKRAVLVATRPAPPPPEMPPSEALKKSISTKRKAPPSRNGSGNITTANISAPIANSTSSSLSPGAEDMRRRSPRIAAAFADEKSAFGKSNATVGLPSNPRQHQTVMYIKDIVYDNPGMVNRIMNELPKLSDKPKPIVETIILDSKPPSGSILQRPRPYKKVTQTERAIFPSEPSPRQHRRSKSGPSSFSRLSALGGNPGSPTTLPPLPAPPAGAAPLKTLLGMNLKNMSADEKISMIFPLPPGVSSMHKRRSSVPSLSRISGELALMLSTEEAATNRRSRRSTIMTLSSQASNKERSRKEVIPETYRKLTGDTQDNKIPDLANNVAPVRKSRIPNHMLKSAFTETTYYSNDEEEVDDEVTDWEWLHEPIAPKTPLQKRAELMESKPIPRSVPKSTDVVVKDQNFLKLMLDTDVTAPSAGSNKNGKSFLSISSGSVTPSSGHPWHTRIGDDIPAFSQRRRQRHSQPLHRPTPLILSKTTSRRHTVVRRPPVPEIITVDSPNKAYKEIQAQLKKLEVPDEGAIDATRSHIPERRSSLAGANDDNRANLLADLEREAGLQETKWMSLHHNFDRDSKSTLSMSPLTAKESSPQATRNDTQRALDKSISQARRSDRALKTQKSSESLRQQRLTEAPGKSKDNIPILLGAMTMSSGFVPTRPARPTPPPASTKREVIPVAASKAMIKRKSLWQPKRPHPPAPKSHMWVQPYRSAQPRARSPEPAAKDVRPKQRRSTHRLVIESTRLWVNPTTVSMRSYGNGLWDSRRMRPKSIVTRPKTQKPTRKSKHMTFLPDIVESPSPLPNKRDTLGIFKFPWGEKSDQPVYQPPIPVNPAVMLPSTTFNSNSRQIESDLEEYSSSFFDDYDDEYPDASDSNSDDAFDESTLWEIANLLDSKEVPSRESLLPQPRIIEDYDEEEDSEYEEDTAARQVRQPTVKFMPIQPLAAKSPITEAHERRITSPVARVLEAFVSPTEPFFKADTWPVPPITTNQQIARAEKDLPDRSSYCLWSGLKISPTAGSEQLPVTFAEAPPAWWVAKGYAPDTAAKVKAEKDALKAEPRVDSAVLSAKAYSQVLQVTNPSNAKASLWQPKPNIVSMNLRTTRHPPAAADVTRKARTVTAPLPVLSSSQLWSSKDTTPLTHHWLSISSIRASSPSLPSSPSSSGRSSPETTSDSLSITSGSTKASSLWSESVLRDIDAVPALRRSLIEEYQSKILPSIPFPEKPTSNHLHIPAPKESSIPRPIWESQIPVLEAPRRRSWRASKPIAMATESAIPTRLARPAATAQDWTAALAEAKQASQIKTTSLRRAVSKAEWAAALHEAVNASSIKSTSIKMWSAAVSQTAGSTPTSRTPLWSGAKVSTPNVSTPRSAAMAMTPIGSGGFKKATPSTPRGLPVLASKSLWSGKEAMSISAAGAAMHWLHRTASARRNAGATWSPVASPALKAREMKVGMWTPSVSQQQGKESDKESGFFGGHELVRKKTVKAATETPALESREMWRPSYKPLESPKEWLVKRRTSRVEFRY